MKKDTYELIEEIREHLGAGFYPEKYLAFTRFIEERLDAIENIAADMERKAPAKILGQIDQQITLQRGNIQKAIETRDNEKHFEAAMDLHKNVDRQKYMLAGMDRLKDRLVDYLED